ncbi:MAG: SCO family protein [Chloroflexi bacterium]|nr:SCO family protein [Chloroflexota bacterium]
MKRELVRAAAVLGGFLALLLGLMLTTAEAKNPFLQPEALAASAPEHRHSGPTAFLGEALMPPRPAADFDLVDWTGERTRLRTFQGKLTLLTFAYTYCPDTCPLLVARFQAVQRALGQRLGEDLELVLVTVDPERDTPERLRHYLEAVDGQRWHFLTGPEPTLERVWKEYRVRVERQGTAVSHTNLTYVIDGNGLLRVRYLGVPPDTVLVSDMEKLLP